MTISWRVAAAALDAGTAVFAAINAAYFVTRLAGSGHEPEGRRAAVFVLAVVGLGALIEALLLLATFAASDSSPLLSSPQWATTRLLACVGSGGICALILRRAAEEG
ncbi:MAG: hypothetical protein J4N36_00280 [Chloroflexi bacterium]|nr:hypothetical protein [Chloroflexota bacterium]MCI0783184.1 hypothetical protein [Chloroflexota bacterium]MCI0814716.1 hypothetical protein [Chloroflexota bacterium]MCI0816840.1 hypothetical protein [Chloroflexota bacterium]MCI0819083.1 hypothetical protein [Chloroflexota bacterium]